MPKTNLRDVALPDVITSAALARVLEIRPETVSRMFRQGVLPGRKLGRRWVTTRHALLAFLSTAQPGRRTPLRLVAEEEQP